MPKRHRDTARYVQADCQSWLHEAGIQGIGIGEKLTKNKKTGVNGLRIYVEQKLPKSKLKAVAPKKLAFGDNDAVPVDVIPIGKLKLHDNTQRIRPLTAGSSIANVSRSAGSLGLVVKSVDDPNTPYILSAYHVLAPVPGKLDKVITQPALEDSGNNLNDRIAEFSAAFPIVFGRAGFPNKADAAVAKVLPGQIVSRSIPFIGIPVDYTSMLRRGQNLRMFGRSSGYKTGKILDPDFKMNLEYPDAGGNSLFAGFRDQVLCTHYADFGDSGSAILNSNDHVIGLHISGSDLTSVFSRITPIFRSLNLEIWQ